MASAGLETTAATMSFLVLLLAIHPEVQEQVFAELSALFADDLDREVCLIPMLIIFLPCLFFIKSVTKK